VLIVTIFGKSKGVMVSKKELRKLSQELPGKYSKIFPFQKRLRKRKNQVFNFLFCPDVPYDNNGSERAIRNLKVKQKVSGGFRSDRGAEIFAILRSVIQINMKLDNPFNRFPNL